MNQVTAFAPATVANIGVGFDVLGMAIYEPGDSVTVTFNNTKTTRIISLKGINANRVSSVVHKNTAGVAVTEFLKSIDRLNDGVDIVLEKNMPMASGLGSSGASAVASAVAVNTLFGEPFSRRELLPFVMVAEKLACGEAHADNVAPSLIGGITLIQSGNSNKLNVVSLPCPQDLYVVIVHPHLEINTKEARRILPENISLKKAIIQLGNISGFIAGLYQEDYNLIRESSYDTLIEPIRSSLVPGFADIKKTAFENGALACSLSGSGPSVFVLTNEKTKASDIADNIQKEWRKINIQSDFFLSSINKEGATITSSR